MSDQDHDARTPDAESPIPTDADLVLEAQPVFEPLTPSSETPVDTPAPTVEEPTAPATEPEPEPIPDPAGEIDEAASATTTPSEEAPATGMWAAVLDRAGSFTPAEPTTTPDLPPAPLARSAAETTSSADSGEVLTGEEVSLSETDPTTTGIVGSRSDSPMETSQIEPVTSSAPRIPSIPTSGAGLEEPPAAPSSVQVPEREDLPAPAPRDVLEHRRDPRQDGDVDLNATTVAPEPVAADSSATAVAAAQVAAGAAATSARDDLDQTRIRRRSLVTPTETSPEESGETQWKPRSGDAEEALATSTPATLDDVIFEGATVVPEVPSRASAHAWGLVLTLLLTPVTWYLLADAGARMTLATNAPMVTGVVNIAAVLELLGGLVLIVFLALLAQRSSLGSFITGLIVLVVSVPWVVAPGWTAAAVLPAMQWLDSWNSFGANISHHLQASGYSARLLVLGLVLLLAAILSHVVRRKGRAEEVLRAEVERVNPEGAFLSRSERRRAAKAAKNAERH